jgi:tight adherence protein B
VSVRARVFALAPRREEPRWWRVARRLLAGTDLVTSPDVLARRFAWMVAAAVAAGGLLAGVAGAVVAVVAAPFGAIAWARRRAARRLERIGDAFPDACRGMADALRSGLNVRQAIERAALDAGGALGAELSVVARELAFGHPVQIAFARFAERCPMPGAELLASACAVVTRTGAQLAPILDGVVASARDRARLQREMRAATAQGRMTAGVVAALPFAFLAMMGAGSRGELDLLLHEPAGWALLAVGVSLQTAGALWIRKVMGRP